MNRIPARQVSIRLRLTCSLVLAITITIGLAAIGFHLFTENELRQNFDKDTRATTAYLTGTFAPLLWNYDHETVVNIAETILRSETVAGMDISGSNGENVFSKHNPNIEEVLIRVVPLHHGKHSVGQLEIHFSHKKINAQLKKTIPLTISTWAISTLSIALLAHFLMRRYFREPLTAFIELAEFYRKHPESSPLSTTPYLEFLPIENVVKDLTNDLQKQLKETRESEEKYKEIFTDAPDMIHVIDPAGIIIDANPKSLAILKYTPQEFIGKPFFDFIHPDFQEQTIANLQALIAGNPLTNIESAMIARNGLRIDTEENMVPTMRGNKLISCQIIARNISDRKRAEREAQKLQAQLTHTQKMESIGTLAGGIAHDFNNLLGVILGFSTIVHDDLEEDSQTRKDIEQVIVAGRRAKDLVKQILAYSRQSESTQIPLQLQPLIKEVLKILRPSLPATIEIASQIAQDLGQVRADPTQIHQILMNLATNAYHAMESTGGTLTIELKHAHLEQAHFPDFPEMESGDYEELIVSDTGSGIAPDILDKIFDPYFTTKEIGKGTGMGLSIIQGIVMDCKGAIKVESELGRGTRFHIYLPQLNKAGETAHQETTGFIPTGTEHILFIDDEESLTSLGKYMLERLGYTVTACTDSLKALSVFKAEPDRFDAVITDQTMPNLTGIDLAKTFLSLRPDLPIVLCTGFSALIDEKTARTIGVREYIYKPITTEELATVLRRAIDAPALSSST